MRGTAGRGGLLERSVGYGLSSLEQISERSLRRPTPCAGWSLADLLHHLDGSIAALREAVEGGNVPLHPRAVPNPSNPPVGAARAARAAGPCLLPDRVADGARQLLESYLQTHRGEARVAGLPITRDVVEIVAAVEITVHGWDVFVACGRSRPIPVGLALDLLAALPRIDCTDRTGLFAPPVPASALGSPGDRLVALLGRRPRR
jgi:uncharacterized protein (TIGR03086 family)